MKVTLKPKSSIHSYVLNTFYWQVYSFTRAIITKCHRQGVLNNKSLLFHSSGTKKSKVKVMVRLVSFWGLSPWLASGHLLVVSSHSHPLVCMSSVSSSLLEGTSLIGLQPTFMISFYLNYLVRGPISKYSHIPRYLGLELQDMNVRAHDLAHKSKWAEEQYMHSIV